MQQKSTRRVPGAHFLNSGQGLSAITYAWQAPPPQLGKPGHTYNKDSNTLHRWCLLCTSGEGDPIQLLIGFTLANW